MSLLGWTDQLPDGWEAKPLRSTANYVVSNVDKVPSEDEIPVRLCNYTDVYNNEFITQSLDFMQATATEEEIEKFGLRVGDVAITKDSESWDDIGVPALVRETASDLVCGYHLALIRPFKQKLDGAFLFRCLQAKPIRVQLELAANGVTRFGIPKSEIGAMALPVPPLPQQRVIAAYLDRETARLDALVAAKQRVLGLLAEKRRALITRSVTRGLDPRASLRDSGIPWLGEIPAHWDVIPLKHGCVLIKDGTHLPPERTMTGIPLLSVRNVVGETFQLLPDDSLIAEQDYEVLSRGFRVEKNDVLLAIVGATLGKVAVVGDMPRFHIQRSLASLRANPMLLDFGYLASCLRSDWFQTNLWESVSFSAQPGIYLGSLRDFVVTRPPIEEQRAIVAHVSGETESLDAVRSATERTIALLGERRTALIAAAVTGEIDAESTA